MEEQIISIVLNFGEKEWDGPINLSDLNIESPYNQFDEPFHIRVFNVKSFTAELRSRFKSDFRTFTEIFCTDALPKGLDDVKLDHPTEVLDMLHAFTKDEKYEEVKAHIENKEEKGESVAMITIFDKYEEKGYAKAKAETAYIQVIKNARFCNENGMGSKTDITRMIEQGLNIPESEAEKIFKKEVLRSAIG